MRILLNIGIFISELAAITAICWLGAHYPYWFAGLTGGIVALLGLWLERARLLHEWPFYFATETGRLRKIGITVWSGLTASFKGILAGLVALLTVSGTDPQRTLWIVAVMGMCIFIGSSLLRRLTISLSARPQRWGFFRLAVPLGILYTQALAGLTVLASISRQAAATASNSGSGTGSDISIGTSQQILRNFDLASMLPVGPLDLLKSLILDLPQRPSVAQSSDALFKLQQAYDGVVHGLLSSVMSPEAAWFAGAMISVKILSGFVVAVYAVIISELVRVLEEASWKRCSVN